MKQRLTRFARRVKRGLPESRASLRARVDRLEREIDELRADRRRVAELIDLIETRLTPSAHAPKAADTRHESGA